MKELLKEVKELRKTLHDHPEPSEQEVETRRILMDFLREHTDVKIVDKGRYFYAFKDEGAEETIAFRGDHDAIVTEDGTAFHGCGHDGHSAILAGLAAYLDGKKTGKNILYIFQHAEENGAGAKECVEIFKEVKPQRIYGLHNRPGYPKGAAVLRKGTVHCASKGLKITFYGKQSHASRPEAGRNPVYVLGFLVKELAPLQEFHGYGPGKWLDLEFSDMVLATTVSVSVGEPGAFGVSPSKGALELTLRAAREEDLEKMEQKIRHLALEEGEKEDLTVTFEEYDVFPETVNDDRETDRVRAVAMANGIQVTDMPEPRRGSEDFGWYLKEVPGCFFGLGAGDTAPLHSVNYEFPDDILEQGIRLFALLAME